MVLAVQYLFDLFNSNNSLHSCNTQNSSHLQATKSHTAYYYHSFTVSGLNLWNSLPRNIQESTSLSIVKSALFMLVVNPNFNLM